MSPWIQPHLRLALPLDFVVTKANYFPLLTEASLSWGFYDNYDSKLTKRQKTVFHDAVPIDTCSQLLSSPFLVSVLCGGAAP